MRRLEENEDYFKRRLDHLEKNGYTSYVVS